VHALNYIQDVLEGTLPAAVVREIGFPWSPELVERSLRSVGGTLAALHHAIHEGVAVNLAGGTHHAMSASGSGFGVFNDVAMAIRHAQAMGRAQRCAVVDLDVHQGNGTAAIFADDASVFTLSLHGERNFPFRKVSSSLDVGQPDGCEDGVYLTALADALAVMDAEHGQRPFDRVFYLAGADPHEHDRLGRMALTAEGMTQRDEAVMRWCEGHGLPVVMCMAGGYGRDLGAMIEVQWQSVYQAWRSWCRRRSFGQ
jgi:acetoin utilization deacetylase AcuC-like enzyme